MIRTTHNLWSGIVKCLHDRAKRIINKPSRTTQEKKHPSTVLVANGYPPSFLQKVTKTRNSTPERETAEFKSTVVLPYIKRVSEPLRRHLQQQGICTVFKSDTTLRSRLVRPKDPTDPNKQDGVVFKIPCTCGKVYIRETGRPMQEKWTSRQGYMTRTHSEFCGLRTCQRHAALERNQIYWLRKPWYTRKVKEGIYIRLNPNKINRDNGTEIPEACTWFPTMRKHLNQRRTKNQRTPEEIMVHGNNSRIEMHQLQQTTMIHNAVPQPVDPIAWRRLAVSSRNVVFHIKWILSWDKRTSTISGRLLTAVVTDFAITWAKEIITE